MRIYTASLGGTVPWCRDSASLAQWQKGESPLANARIDAFCDEGCNAADIRTVAFSQWDSTIIILIIILLLGTYILLLLIIILLFTFILVIFIVISTTEKWTPGAVVSWRVPRVAQCSDAVVLFLPLTRTTSQTLGGPAL